MLLVLWKLSHRHRRDRDRCGEGVGLRGSPGRHEAAVGDTGDAHAIARDDPGLDQGIDAGEDVLEIAAPEVAEVGARELLPAAGASADVGQQHGVALVGQHQAQVHRARGEVVRPGARRAAVDEDDERQGALRSVLGQHQQPLDLLPVPGLPCVSPHLGSAPRERCVDPRQLPPAILGRRGLEQADLVRLARGFLGHGEDAPVRTGCELGAATPAQRRRASPFALHCAVGGDQSAPRLEPAGARVREPIGLDPAHDRDNDRCRSPPRMRCASRRATAPATATCRDQRGGHLGRYSEKIPNESTSSSRTMSARPLAFFLLRRLAALSPTCARARSASRARWRGPRSAAPRRR
jgi:hypothetical protein